MGETKNAIDCYEKVLQIDPNNTNAHYNLGITAYELKELKKAIGFYKKTIEIQPNYAMPSLLTAILQAESKPILNQNPIAIPLPWPDSLAV